MEYATILYIWYNYVSWFSVFLTLEFSGFEYTFVMYYFQKFTEMFGLGFVIFLLYFPNVQDSSTSTFCIVFQYHCRELLIRGRF